MPYKEKEIKKLYYSIGEVSKLLDIKPSTIRHWEKEFKEIKPRKNRKGDRMFTDKDIYHLKVVQKLVHEDKQSLTEANSHIKEHKAKINNTYDAIKRLAELRYEMLKLKEQLQLQRNKK